MPAKNLRRTALALLIEAALAVSPVQAADQLRVAKPAAIGFGFSMLDAGINAGIFRKYDLDVEALVLEGAAKQHQAMMAHATDISMGAAAFPRGWFETIRWADSHKDDALRYSMEATKLPIDISSAAYDAEMAMFYTDGHFRPEDVAAVIRAMKDTGMIDQTPDLKQIMTEEYLK